MSSVKSWLRMVCPGILLVCLMGSPGAGAPQTDPAGAPTAAVEESASLQAVRDGVALEQSRSWLDAIEHYESAVKIFPESKDLQYGLRRSKIHFNIERRYADVSFEQNMLRLSRSEALYLFDTVMLEVQKHYIDPISATSFVAHGTESLYLALANDKFVANNIPNADPQNVRKLRTILREQYWNRPVPQASSARQTVTGVCDMASQLVGLRDGAVIMEYVFGGCNALDDYSNYLTPDRWNDLYSNIEGEFVGIGIEMKSETGKGLLLVNVLPESPAAEGGVQAGEHIIAIDGVDCRSLTTDEAARYLRGPTGSTVRLTLLSTTDAEPRQATLKRREVHVKSIPVVKMLNKADGIGYIQMSGFQQSTVQELDAALYTLQRQGMRALVWDVRGNPGGLLTDAVEVLDRFIGDGVLVSTRGRTYDQNYVYSAHSGNKLNVPLVLLVDGNSASASEIVAGAIHDHHRGTIVGRQTYGKWSVQSMLPLHSQTGLRLTTAKFYSPNGLTLGKIGVKPDVVVDRPESDHVVAYRGGSDSELLNDADVERGMSLLRTQLARQ